MGMREHDQYHDINHHKTIYVSLKLVKHLAKSFLFETCCNVYRDISTISKQKCFFF